MIHCMSISYHVSSERVRRNGSIYDPRWKEVREHMLKICERSNNMIVSIFDVNQKQFLGFSNSLDNILGYKSVNFTAKGWTYWFSKVDSSEVQVIKSRITDFLYNSRIINDSAIYLTYHIRSAQGKWCFIKHEIELRIFEKEIIAISYICDYSSQEKIDCCFSSEYAHKASRILLKINISSREMDVLCLIADGLSSKQIGDKLCISYNTVISHRKHLLEKFRVQNTAQLIRNAGQLIRL